MESSGKATPGAVVPNHEYTRLVDEYNKTVANLVAARTDLAKHRVQKSQLEDLLTEANEQLAAMPRFETLCQVNKELTEKLAILTDRSTIDKDEVKRLEQCRNDIRDLRDVWEKRFYEMKERAEQAEGELKLARRRPIDKNYWSDLLQNGVTMHRFNLKDILKDGKPGDVVPTEGSGWEGEATSGGTKHDSDKPRMDLIDSYAMEMLAEVLTFGAKKYAAHNWRKGIAYSRLIAAALRHIYAINNGQNDDPETGLPHAAHAMCCMMFLVWMQAERDDMDDRWEQPESEDTDALVNEDLQAKGIDKSPHPYWKNHLDQPNPTDSAMQHADALFSQYGVAPRRSEWKAFSPTAGALLSDGDLVRLRNSPVTWKIMGFVITPHHGSAVILVDAYKADPTTQITVAITEIKEYR